MSDDPSRSNPLPTLQDTLRKFAAERDWDQFHSPKNLAIAISVESAELLEHFQWLRDDDSRNLTPDRLEKVREEMADILICLLRLADKLNIDLVEASKEKIAANATKYPVDKSRGSSRKYTGL